MRYKKIQFRDKDDTLRKLGCKYPGSTEWYSYYNTDPNIIRSQSCVGLFSSLKPSTKKKYEHVQHYARHVACKEAEEVLCVRYKYGLADVRSPDWVIITSHPLGACPLCNYHTEAEFFRNANERFGRDIV
jgi:hypothetical protein